MKSKLMRVGTKFGKIVKEIKVKKPGISDRQVTDEIADTLQKIKSNINIVGDLEF